MINRRELLKLVPAGLLAPRPTLAADPTKSREVPWLGEVQTPPAELPADAPQLSTLLVPPAGQGEPRLQQWAKRRRELRQWWLEFLGAGDRSPQPPRLQLLDEERVGSVLRQRVGYASEPNWPTEAYLLRPAELDEPAPGVAVFHSTVDHSILQPAGVQGKSEKAFGLRLAERGFVTICPRNYLWPTNQRIDAVRQTQAWAELHPHARGMAKMLHDAVTAVDILAALDYVDGERIGAVGHSLGAKEVLYLAAFDERIKATVSSEGGIGTRFSNWDAPWYLGPAVAAPGFDHEHHELLAMIAPRALLLIGGDSADGDRSWPFIEAAMPIYRLYGSPPRVGLFNHRQGHAVPPPAEQRIDEWVAAYL